MCAAAMRAVVPTAIAHSAYGALLWWAFLFCTQSAQTCVNGLVEPTIHKRLGRLLQATTLVNAPQHTSSGGFGGPPVNSTIFGSSLRPGWAVKSRGSRGVRQQQVKGAVNNGSQAFCATLPAKDDEIFFNCQNCSQTGYGPFELNKTSGFQLTVRRTNLDYSAYDADPSQARLPDVQMKLGNDSLEPSQCNFGLVTYAETLNPERTLFTVWYNDDMTNSTRDDSTGLFTREFLFQNYQACIESRASLANVTSIGFSSNTANVSFCLEDFSLLPTQVPSAEVLDNATAVSYPRFPNCRNLTPQKVDEDGYYLVVQDMDTEHNITGIPQAAGYTVFPGVDVPGSYDMKPVDVSTPAEPNLDFSCSMNRFAPNITQVNACAKGRGICCIDTGPYLSMHDSTYLPQELAKICDGLTINGTVCQGFNYNGNRQLAVFKGQAPNVPLDMKHDACNNPGFSLWALNAALSFTETDPRMIAAPPAPPPPPPAPPSPIPPPPPPAPESSTDSKVATAWGIAAAVAGPTIAIATWFVLTWGHRSEKKIIANEVIRRLKASDICATDVELQNMPAGVGPGYQSKQPKKIGAFHPSALKREQPLDDMVRSGSFTSAVSAPSDLASKFSMSEANASDGLGDGEPSPETKTVARQLTSRYLRRWDGWMGIRASSDSLGNRAGIWRGRYDTVRCAVLLLAFRRLNQALQDDPSSFRADHPGSLLAAWQGSNSRAQRRDVISWISKKVQEITEDDAQALEDKDPEHAGLYDEMCNRLTCCNGS